MNLPFEVTVGGAMIVVLMIIVGFLAWQTGNNLLFLILSFLAASLVVGFIVGNFCLKKLDVKMRFPETIYAGELTPILVSLHNRKRIFPTFSVVAQVRGKEREQSILFGDLKQILPAKWADKITKPPIVKHTLDYFVHIPRRETAENKAEHIFRKRGRFIIKDFELSTKFPFGFFRHRRRLSAQETEIIIFPPIAPVDEETVDLPIEIGKLITNKKGLGQDLLGMRDYQPLDDLRRVDWKATARVRRLIVREFSAEDDRRVTIIFDTRLRNNENNVKLSLREKIEAEQKSVSPVSERFEKGVSRTASMLAHFTEDQSEIRLIIDGNIGEFGIGAIHLNENLKRLALVEPNFDEAAQLPFEVLEDILYERENSCTFFVTAERKENLPDELIQETRIVNF
ncbi:MAG: DUF58 domain-containing protein, partial [Acidobacteriota bacterium]|nr:DUF58 domain-containing protein [Acidobacteriota bacterium]